MTTELILGNFISFALGIVLWVWANKLVHNNIKTDMHDVAVGVNNGFSTVISEIPEIIPEWKIVSLLSIGLALFIAVVSSLTSAIVFVLGCLMGLISAAISHKPTRNTQGGFETK